MALALGGIFAGRHRIGRPRLLAAVLFAQLVSHPLVWFVLPRLWLSNPWPLWIAESFAVVSELGLYRLVFPDVELRRLAVLSLAANFSSWALGAALLG